MPDDAIFAAVVELALDGFGGEQLRITHDMLLQAVRFVYIGQSIVQYESQPLAAQQRGTNAVGWAVGVFVGDELGIAADDFEVIVFQDFQFRLVG